MDKKDLRVVFMGTPELSAEVLNFVINNGYHVVGLIAQEDRPVGRKRIIKKVPTKVIAEKYNIPVFQPHKIRSEYEFVKDLKPDLILTMAYGQIIPQGLLDIPKYLCLNLHASILPKYRGAAPIERAIENGEKVSGVTLMEMIDKMDAGRIFAIRDFEILETDNYASIIKKIINASYQLVDEEIMPIIEGKNKGVKQDESLVTFADKIKPEDEKIDLEKTKKQIFDQIRALSPHIGAYLFLGEKKFKIFEAVIYDDVISPKREILIENRHLLLALKDGRLALKMVQLEGHKMMNDVSFINGYNFLLPSSIK